MNRHNKAEIIYNAEKAVGISIPESWLENVPADSLPDLLKIIRAETGIKTPILGNYDTNEGIVFRPLIPFTKGFVYQIALRNNIIGTFAIAPPDQSNPPRVTAIYPDSDTLPENLLKFYLQFSKPMREGDSNKYIRLVKDETDTLEDVFLNLQPELWNEEGTVLTIWFDPGRVKRKLIPNQKLGAPLTAAASYSLVVSEDWKDQDGVPLQNTIRKKFNVSIRDESIPDMVKWSFIYPKSSTRQPIKIILNEPLDYFLLQETLTIHNQKGHRISGKITSNKAGTNVFFVPEKTWLAGNYQLRSESRLEDLAGNNLERLFDHDLKLKKAAPGSGDINIKSFHIL